MVLRILNTADWSLLEVGKWLVLNGDHDRKLVVEINCEAPTVIHIVQDGATGRRVFLGVVQGMEKIEVYAKADAYLDFTTEGEVWWFTNDGATSAVEIPEEASFTKLLGRRSRSDQLELMLQKQAMNYERLLNQQAAELEAWQQSVGQQADPNTGEIDDENGDGLATGGDGTQPEPSNRVEPAPAPAGQAPSGGAPAAVSTGPAATTGNV